MPKQGVIADDKKQNGQPNKWISRINAAYQATYIINFVISHRQVITDLIKEMFKR